MDRELNRKKYHWRPLDPGRIDHARGPVRLVIRTEGRAAQAGHDRGVQQQYLDRKREIEAAGGMLVEVRTELELKRLISRDLRRHFDLTGQLPIDVDLEQIARGHGCGVVDGKIKIPDCQITYQTSGGSLKTENQDYRSGSGRRLAVKLMLGFQIGGMRRRKGLIIRDTLMVGRRALPDEKREL
jgi:hypothetical protein